MASDVFTIMARKNVSPFLIRKIIILARAVPVIASFPYRSTDKFAR